MEWKKKLSAANKAFCDYKPVANNPLSCFQMGMLAAMEWTMGKTWEDCQEQLQACNEDEAHKRELNNEWSKGFRLGLQCAMVAATMKVETRGPVLDRQ